MKCIMPIDQICMKTFKGAFVIAVSFLISMNALAGFRISEGHYLNIGGSNIYYEEDGAGETIVLIHDGLMNSSVWDGEWNILLKKFHVIRYDRRGYGLSDIPAKPFSQSDDLLASIIRGEVIIIQSSHRFIETLANK